MLPVVYHCGYLTATGGSSPLRWMQTGMGFTSQHSSSAGGQLNFQLSTGWYLHHIYIYVCKYPSCLRRSKSNHTGSCLDQIQTGICAQVSSNLTGFSHQTTPVAALYTCFLVNRPVFTCTFTICVHASWQTFLDAAYTETSRVGHRHAYIYFIFGSCRCMHCKLGGACIAVTFVNIWKELHKHFLLNSNRLLKVLSIISL